MDEEQGTAPGERRAGLLHSAISWLQAGLILTLFNLNVGVLPYLSRSMGMIALYLGCRALRRENRGFRTAWQGSLVLMGVQAAAFFVEGTPLNQRTNGMAALGLLSGLFLFGIMIYLRRGFREAYAALGAEPERDPYALGAGAYAAMALLGFLGLGEAVLLVVGLMVLLVVFLWGAWRLGLGLGELGYEPKPEEKGAWRAPGVFCLASILAVALGVGLSARPITQALARDPGEGTAMAELRSGLLELGFPAVILDDLDAEELARYTGAVSVHCEGEAAEAWGGRLELATVHVAMEDHNRILTWFRWLEPPAVRGRDGFFLQPGDKLGFCDNFAGRLLYERGGAAYAVPFESLEWGTAGGEGPFFGSEAYRTPIGEFSLPWGGENLRGYLGTDFYFYRDTATIYGFIFNYVHQKSWLNYPWQGVEDVCRNYLGNAGAFARRQAYTLGGNLEGMESDSDLMQNGYRPVEKAGQQ